MQSGEDNNVALTNDPNDRNAILIPDLCTFQLREYKAMARLAGDAGQRPKRPEKYRQKASQLRVAMHFRIWFAREKMLFNVRRDAVARFRHISGSISVPLIEDILPRADARAMIRRYLWNPDLNMLAPHWRIRQSQLQAGLIQNLQQRQHDRTLLQLAGAGLD